PHSWPAPEAAQPLVRSAGRPPRSVERLPACCTGLRHRRSTRRREGPHRPGRLARPSTCVPRPASPPLGRLYRLSLSRLLSTLMPPFSRLLLAIPNRRLETDRPRLPLIERRPQNPHGFDEQRIELLPPPLARGLDGSEHRLAGTAALPHLHDERHHGNEQR